MFLSCYCPPGEEKVGLKYSTEDDLGCNMKHHPTNVFPYCIVTFPHLFFTCC